MLSDKIKYQIRRVRLKVSTLVGSSVVGNRRLPNQGTGFEFDQLREYQFGDDVRFIDWKSSARAGRTLTKQFFEDRNQKVVVALDISRSSFVGSNKQIKIEFMAELAAIFTLVAQGGRDEVGLVLFSDKIELYSIPAIGNGHVQKILEQIFTCDKLSDAIRRPTNLKAVLAKMGQVLNKKNLILLISDFIDQNDFSQELQALGRRHDVVAVRWLDQFEHAFPVVGLLQVQDPETGQLAMLDLRKTDLRQHLKQRVQSQNKQFISCGVGLLDIRNPDHVVGEIISFFQKRQIAR